MQRNQGLPTAESLQRRLSLFQAIDRTSLPWRLKKRFHRILFPSYIDILDRDSQCRPILFVSPNLPYPDRGGTDFRLGHILNATVLAGYSISFLSLCERDLLAGSFCKMEDLGRLEDFLKYEKSLREIPVSHLMYGVDALEKVLKKNPEAFSAFFISWPKSVKAILSIIKRHAPNIPVIYDMVDYHALRLERQADLLSDIKIKAKANEFQSLESESARRTDLTLAISEEEKNIFLRTTPSVKVDVLGNYFEVPEEPCPGSKNRTGMLFVGSFVHAPNVDSVLWFAQEIFPLIKKRHPSIVFHVAGNRPPPEILALSKDPNIKIYGWVPDLTELFRSARVFVAPLRYGAGVKGKIGLSMAYGLPVVTTGIGIEGMDLTVGEDCEVAELPEEFAEKTERLLSDDHYWESLSNQGRLQMIRKSSTKSLPNKMREIFESLGVAPLK